MTKLITLFTFFLFINLMTKAQTITGTVKDTEDQKPVAGATVSLLVKKDSALIKNVVTDAKGDFQFTEVAQDSFIIKISSMNYDDYASLVSVKDTLTEIGTLFLLRKGKDLTNITVVAQAPPVTQKGDTTQYSANQYKVNSDATAEELIKKMPGITVDKSTGAVTAQGEQVKKVTVDGKEYFGDDATATLKNLPAEIIDKIQVFDKLSDQAQFTGFDDGNTSKSINIVTKTGTRNGQFGRIYAGYGTDDRYAAGGNVSFFKGDRRISLIGLFNNINQQNFGNEDLLGVTSSGGGRGGGGRSGGNRGGGNAGNFLVGQQSGIATTNAFGINYSDKWGKKLDVTGSYFFNDSKTNNNQLSNNEYFIKDTANQFYDESSLIRPSNNNHRVNMRMEYKIDSFNSIIFTPTVSFQKNDANNVVSGVRYYTLGDLISSTKYNTSNDISGFNTNNNLLYRHAFAKRGRTISVNLNVAANHRSGDIYLQSINEYYDGNTLNDSIQQYTSQLVNGTTYGGNISYTEPIGKKGQLQLSYSPSVTKNKSDQEVYQFNYVGDKYNLFDSSLSNIFDNTVNTHTGGISYRIGDRDNMFSIGGSYKYTGLNSQRLFPQVGVVDKSFSNFLPNLMWRKKLSTKTTFNINYRMNTNVPSVNQLQDVINNSNPLFLTSGNPDLKQQISNTLSARLTYTNPTKGSSFFANIYLQQTDNYVANATYIAYTDSAINNSVILYKGGQLTKPVNLDGYLSLRSFITVAMPLKFIKSNFNINGGFSWSKIPGIVNYNRSLTNNYTYTTGAVLSSNISEYVDFNLSYNTNFSVAKNSALDQLNNHYRIQNIGMQVNLLSKNGWFLQNDVNNQSYTGLSAGYNQNYWLWNAALGKKFLKNQAAELKLSVFDLLKQNRSITRNVTESYIEDIQNEVLTQYFMLTFSYKLKNFGNLPSRNNINEGRQRQRDGGGGPMNGGGPNF